MKHAVDEIFKVRDSFVIIGITGRSGSGCTTVANLLSQTFKGFNAASPCIPPGVSSKERKERVVYEYQKANWKEFTPIFVRDIITSFVLEGKFDEFNDYINKHFECDISAIKSDYDNFYNLNKCLDDIAKSDYKNSDHKQVSEYFKKIPTFTNKLKEELNKDDGRFIGAYQAIGNNIRRFGVAVPGEANTGNIFSIARRINGVIKVLRKHNREQKRSDMFVIDSFRNPFEILFFQQRYASFYLFSISAPESERIDRLRDEINTEKRLVEINSAEDSCKESLAKIDEFVKQDMPACIQLADIYLSNPGTDSTKNLSEIKQQILRYVALIRHPGIITPSRNERMMQIAYTAKLNSGCLSRQVGQW